MNPEKLIIKYFNNTLSKAEELQFTSLLDTDANFKTLFNEHKDMQVAFKINEESQLKDFLNSIDMPKKSIVKVVWSKKNVLAIACSVLIGFFYFLNRENSSTIYKAYFEEYPNVLEPIVRGGNTTNSKAFNSYESKLYSKAEKQFKEILNTKENNNLEFYYAMSLLNQNKTEEALITLEGLKLKEHDFMAEVLWYTALIAIKNKDFEAAKEELKTIEILGFTFQKEKREALLSRIE